jgi:hypothetical protein
VSELSYTERELMEHATAWHHHRRLYRNHFVTGPGTTDWPTVQALCSRGLMMQTRAPSELSGGDAVFTVTEAGIAKLREPQRGGQ